MEVRAIARYVKVQPRKVRIIADEVRGKSATHTDALLKYHPSKSARALRKVLVSAMANAQENHQISADNLRIATIMIDEGPRQKRMRARAMGRGFRILKKTSHITVVVEEFEPAGKVKPHGTQAKPRPTFAQAKKSGAKKKGAEAPVEEVLQPEPTDTAVENVSAAPAAADEGVNAQPEPQEATPVSESDASPEGAGTPDLEHESTAEAEGTPAEEEKGAE
jgi:large subunit ribosomal protein L22